ncbi:MAG TPA: FAD-dependent oxidoreductase [Deferrisomatales bacterium]|nr:FAD-dependent oxidoreductase [Deferrisomatales bacterium]
MEDPGKAGLSIAVVGGGVAGITAAYLLQRRHAVTLYEKNDYVGGHTHTIEIPGGPDRGLPVDTGFIVLNDRTYPLFNRLLQKLGVGVRDTEMSFSFQSATTGLEYAGTGLNGLFAQRRNLWRPSHWRLLYEIVRFCRKARFDLEIGGLAQLTLQEYVDRCGCHPTLVSDYLVPMASAIWSTPPGRVTEFPVEPFLRFFQNHGLLSPLQRPRWQTVVGGSHAYVGAFLREFRGTVHTQAPVRSIRRDAGGIAIETASGGETRYDRVVVATHADEVLALLAEATAEERTLFGAWRYQPNRVVLHTDASFLPSNRRAWACWNYRSDPQPAEEALGCVTYLMNALQGFRTATQYCVTLNPIRPVPPQAVIRELQYSHPTYSFTAMETQPRLPALNGVRQTYYCGSYFGYGFHEDAVRSAVAVGGAFGLEL